MDKLFDTKRKYIAYDGEEYINMCIPVVKIKDMYGHDVEELTQDYNGRIDNFVWRNVARNMDMIDMVMYANHIFNPFAVQEGDVLNIPIDNDNFYQGSDEPSLPDGSKHSKNSRGEKNRSYAETVAYMARMNKGWK